MSTEKIDKITALKSEKQAKTFHVRTGQNVSLLKDRVLELSPKSVACCSLP